MKKQPMNKTAKALAVGGGVALAAALVAGAYFLYGKDGAKNRKKVRGWALKMKGEILEQMEKAPEVSEALYHRLIDEGAKRYEAISSVDPKELTDMVKELKGHWKSIKKQLTSKPQAAVKTVVRKTVAKVKSMAKKK